MTPLPPAFVERMAALLGDESSAFFAALADGAEAGLRANTLKASADAVRGMVPWALEAVPWCPSGFRMVDEARAGKHPFHAAGLYYLQEPTAMAVAEALAPRPGEWVLDVAAAPGGKATHLACLLEDKGLLVANEVDGARARTLAQNIERCGVRNALVLSEPPERLAERWGAIFDRVLFDAPCSGEGMFRKSEAARADWSEAHVRGCALRQARGLESAARLVRPDGLLAYSTCTFAPEENEQIIAAFLDNHPQFALEACAVPHADPGRDEWVTRTPIRRDTRLGKTVRLWTHRVRGEGHYIALLRRVEGDAEAPSEQARWTPANRRAAEQWKAFRAAQFGIDPAEGMALAQMGERLVAVPEQAPAVAGMRVMQAGVMLGEARNGRFVPAHSLAVTVRRAEMDGGAPPMDLAPDDPRLARYLAGHPLESAGEDGWALIAVNGYPLGWGRRAGGVLKNHYPKGLRWTEPT